MIRGLLTGAKEKAKIIINMMSRKSTPAVMKTSFKRKESAMLVGDPSEQRNNSKRESEIRGRGGWEYR